MAGKMTLLLLVVFDLHAPGLCEIKRTRDHRQHLSFATGDPENNFAHLSSATIGEASRSIYVSRIGCNSVTGGCFLEQHRLEWGASRKVSDCQFKAPPNVRQVSLTQLGDEGQRVIVDWARVIQVIDSASCGVDEIPVELSARGDEMHRIVLNSSCGGECFELLHLDPKRCGEGGWASIEYDARRRSADAPRCIRGLSRAKYKFAVDAASQPYSGPVIVVEKNQEDWSINCLAGASDTAKALYTEKSREEEMFYLPRLSVNESAVLCWLPDLTFAKDINCVAVNLLYDSSKNFTLRFPSEVRDFEILSVGLDRLYVLTSYSEPRACDFNLWLFDLEGRAIDGPASIRGPECVFTHRLSPRPVLTRHISEVCASFVFERKSHKPRNTSTTKNTARKFTVHIDCFQKPH